jgi:predicted ATP-grasp superfamily ATP-dependent carboligase
MTQTNILVINALTRNSLAVAASLKNAGYTIYGIEKQPSGYLSRFISGNIFPKLYKKVFFYHAHTYENLKIFENEIINTIKAYKIKIVIPTGTKMSLLISKLKPILLNYCLVPVEDYDRMNIFHDKFKTVQMAKKIRIPHPTTILVKDKNNLNSAMDSIQFPAVLKTRKGSGTDGVWYAQTREEMYDNYKNLNHHGFHNDGIECVDRSQPMVQEFIPGELHDVTAFCVRGEAKCLLTQKRLVTAPLSGGGGIVNITTLEPLLKEYAKRFIEETQWDGILEFDFKLDERDGKPKLLEINPKIWGTTWLTITAGYDYPLYLVRQSLGEAYELPEKYTVGLICRWPLSEIMTWFEKPITIRTVCDRILNFKKLFNEKPTVYDPIFCDKKFLFGRIAYQVFRSLGL